MLTYEETHEVDSGGLVDDLIFIQDTLVAALITELKDGRTRISLRSRCEIDVADVARSLNPTGGGHKRSAGVTVDLSLEDAAHELNALLAILFKD